jgi:hypothetical protein
MCRGTRICPVACVYRGKRPALLFCSCVCDMAPAKLPEKDKSFGLLDLVARNQPSRLLRTGPVAVRPVSLAGRGGSTCVQKAKTMARHVVGTTLSFGSNFVDCDGQVAPTGKCVVINMLVSYHRSSSSGIRASLDQASFLVCI